MCCECPTWQAVPAAAILRRLRDITSSFPAPQTPFPSAPIRRQGPIKQWRQHNDLAPIGQARVPFALWFMNLCFTPSLHLFILIYNSPRSIYGHVFPLISLAVLPYFCSKNSVGACRFVLLPQHYTALACADCEKPCSAPRRARRISLIQLAAH